MFQIPDSESNHWFTSSHVVVQTPLVEVQPIKTAVSLISLGNNNCWLQQNPRMMSFVTRLHFAGLGTRLVSALPSMHTRLSPTTFPGEGTPDPLPYQLEGTPHQTNPPPPPPPPPPGRGTPESPPPALLGRAY